MSTLRFLYRPKVVKLELGKTYWVSLFNRPLVECQFIQTTPKGFNLLDVNTSKCVLKPHLYHPKRLNENEYFVNFSVCKILELDKKII